MLGLEFDALTIRMGSENQRRSEPPFLRLPTEVRLQIFSLLHDQPRISIESDEVIFDSLENSSRPDQVVRRLLIDPPASLSHKCFCVISEHYYWSYLLTCKTFNQEAYHLLPPLIHLRVASKDFQVNYIPPGVRKKYLPSLGTLEVVSRYPLYNFLFDGSELRSLKTLYLLDEGCRSRLIQHHAIVLTPSLEQLALIQGDHDHLFITQGLDKVRLSKMNWWQNGSKLWLHNMLSLEGSDRVRLIVQQHVFLRFEQQRMSRMRYTWILLVCYSPMTSYNLFDIEI